MGKKTSSTETSPAVPKFVIEVAKGAAKPVGKIVLPKSPLSELTANLTKGIEGALEGLDPAPSKCRCTVYLY